MVGGIEKPILNASDVEKIVEIVRMFVLNMTQVKQALKVIRDADEKKELPSQLRNFVSLVDSMRKAGRLDTSMKVYMEMQGFGLRPSATMYVSMIESFVKAASPGLWA
ncbi:hypothetical protein LIER_38178 [Lithospermum erythrorhizon]|uniref:Pentatricopeptide repeat-containing protein n=1 Tax=Lithospermum erythrorhizon TaxID=34254 RepID=A0AAV3PVQ8_LITER